MCKQNAALAAAAGGGGFLSLYTVLYTRSIWGDVRWKKKSSDTQISALDSPLIIGKIENMFLIFSVGLIFTNVM